jgi:hypothetical protein
LASTKAYLKFEGDILLIFSLKGSLCIGHLQEGNPAGGQSRGQSDFRTKGLRPCEINLGDCSSGEQRTVSGWRKRGEGGGFN